MFIECGDEVSGPSLGGRCLWNAVTRIWSALGSKHGPPEGGRIGRLIGVYKHGPPEGGRIGRLIGVYKHGPPEGGRIGRLNSPGTVKQAEEAISLLRAKAT